MQRLTQLQERPMNQSLTEPHSTLQPRLFPLPVVTLHLLFAIPARIHLTPDKTDQEIIVLIDIAPLLARRKLMVSIHNTLRNERKPGQDGRMPLHDMFLNAKHPSAPLASLATPDRKPTNESMRGVSGPKYTHQRMPLGLLEIITPIQRIEPTIQKEPRPLPPPHHKTPRTQRLRILRQHQVDLVRRQVREGPDHAVRRHHGLVLEHQAFEPCRG